MAQLRLTPLSELAQLRLTPLSELPSRPARSTSSESRDARAGDGLWDAVLTKADPVHPADGPSADAVLQDAAWAEGQGQFALAATLYSRAFWSIRYTLDAAPEPQASGGGLLSRLGLGGSWHAAADTPGSGGAAALDSYLAMVRCRLILGDCGFVCDALHVLELQMWRLGKPLVSNSAHARLFGELLAKAAGDMLCVVARLLARPHHEAMLGEGTLHVHLHRAEGLGPPGGDAADPFVRLSLAGNQGKSRTVSRTRDPVWDERFELRGSLRQLLSEPMLLHAVAAERGAARAESLGSALVDVGGALCRAADAELAVEMLAAGTDAVGAAVPAGVVHVRLAWRADAAEAEMRDDEAAAVLLAEGRAANDAGKHAAAAAAFAGACVRQPKPTSVLSLANMLAKAGRTRAALALLALLSVSGLRSAMNAATAREVGTRRAELGMACLLRLLSGGGGSPAAGAEEEGGRYDAEAEALAAKERLSLPVDHPERSGLAAEMARRGHAANAEDDLHEAARCFAAAFRLRAAPAGGGAAAMLSLCAMRRRQGHAGWSARGVALLLASARPMSDAERSAAARLGAAPAAELPPVWTATMLDEVAASLVWLPNAEVFCSGEGLFFTSPAELEAAVAAEAEAFAAAQAAEAEAADAERAAQQARAEAERAAHAASAATTAAAERACRWAEAEAQLDAMMSPQQPQRPTAVAGASPSEHLLGLARILAESPKQRGVVR